MLVIVLNILYKKVIHIDVSSLNTVLRCTCKNYIGYTS